MEAGRVGALVLLLPAALLAPAAPARGNAGAGPATDMEMPFRCHQPWTGTTRSSHSPSVFSIDWNRENDFRQRTLASGSGVVTRVEDFGDRSYGRFVVVEHRDSESTLYAHLDATFVTAGQHIDQGQVLGLVGSSGGSTGPHLHYEQRRGSRHVQAWFHDAPYEMGTTQRSRSCPDTPVAGDWDGDGVDELGVLRRKARGRFRLLDDGVTVHRTTQGTDDPVAGDWDGDGADEVGTHRSRSRLFALRLDSGQHRRLAFGRVGDVGVAGDWDGDGDGEVGVWRPATRRFHLQPTSDGVRRHQLGSADAIPVTGDWNGDGRTDLGAFDEGSWSLWLRRPNGTHWSGTVALGSPTDLPVTGDWNGDGADDLGVWAPESAVFTLRKAEPLSTGPGRLSTRGFGRAR